MSEVATAPVDTTPAPAAEPAPTPATALTDTAPAPAAEGEPKPEGDTKPADGDKPAEGAKEGDKPAGAPETYAEFKAPEGMQLDAKAVEAFAPVAKELNLSQEQAQKLVDLVAAQRKAEAEASVQAVTEMRAGWVAAAKADKEVGGPNWDQNLGVAKAALTKFGTAELTQALNETGLGDHPEVIRFFHRVGKALAEDKVVAGSPAASAPKSAAERMFPNDPFKRGAE